MAFPSRTRTPPATIFVTVLTVSGNAPRQEMTCSKPKTSARALRFDCSPLNESGARSPEPTEANAQAQTGRIKIVDAVSTYFANLEAQGKDPKSIRTYKIAVDGFVASCSKMFRG